MEFFVGQKVFYNGGTVSYFGTHIPPIDLIKHHVYTIRDIIVHSWYTDIMLEEVSGTFNSTWFEPSF